MNKVKLSVIIPAFNEEDNLKRGSLQEVFNYLKTKKYLYEVLVVNDGSKDNTEKIVLEQIKKFSSFKMLQNVHQGKATAVMTGLLASKGEVVVFSDMDQATPISEVEKFFPKFEEGFDIVIGSRKGRRGAPLVRKLAAFGFAILRNLILGLPFKDTQCGFKGFNQKAIKTVIPDLMSSWQNFKANKGAAVNAGFDVEVLFLAKKRDLKIVEVEVNWHHVGTERVQIIKDALEAIKDILRIRINDLAGKY